LVVLVVLILVGANVIPAGEMLKEATFSEMPLLLNLSLPLACSEGLKFAVNSNFTIDDQMAFDAMQEAVEEFNHRANIEQRLFLQMNLTSGIRTPTKYHQKSTVSSPQFKNMTDSAVVAELSVLWLLKQGVTADQLLSVNADALLKEWVHCSKEPSPACMTNDRFRTIDGTCNNLEYPLWGSTLQPQRRSLPPVYDNQITSPRTLSVIRGRRLPSPRRLSLSFSNASAWVTPQEKKLSMLFLTWGQFMDHDLVATVASKGINGSAITCCDQIKLHPECFPIMVERDDPFYADKDVRCLDLVRSAPAPQCKIDAREQTNEATSYIDGSQIYGSDETGAKYLRQFKKGNLKGRLSTDGRWLLPISSDPKDGCNQPEEVRHSRYCFRAGDARVNDQFGLTSLHTIMMREHNRISTRLSQLNPHWDDERLFQETRRILGAMLQHITYNEFVPLLLGDTLTDHLKLRPLKEGYDDSYNPKIHAATANEFAAAAYRLHSMLQGLVEFDGPHGNNIDFTQLKNILFNPFELWDFGRLDAFMRGSAQQSPRKMDTSFSPQVTNHMFQGKASYGMDMFSINIQRGRDNGVSPYINWRNICKLTPVANWSDLEEIMRPSSLHVLKNTYQDLRDVDLYTGILSELPLPGSIIGPVGTCILADQFLRTKIGDRFWYETSNPLVRFSRGQLQELRKVTLARLLCDDGDALDVIQTRVMERVTPANPRKRCSEIPAIDLSYWESVDGIVPPFTEMIP